MDDTKQKWKSEKEDKFSLGPSRCPETVDPGYESAYEINLDSTKHLSSLPRRRKWKFRPKPKRIKKKNYLYSISDINIFLDTSDIQITDSSESLIPADSYRLSCLDRVFLADNEYDETCLIRSIEMDGWELPLFSDFEDTSCYMSCPDENIIVFNNIDSYRFTEFMTSDHCVFANNGERKISYKEVKKLHRAMWHSKAEHLQKWLIRPEWTDDAKRDAKLLISKVIKNCSTCLSIKQPHGRPKDFGIKAEFPNEIVVMDQAFLKDEETQNSYPFLHIMDVATRWSLAHTITGRGGNVGGFDVIKALYLWEQMWGSPPQIMFSDRGREFINSRVFEYCQVKDVIQLTSPARTPASNGLIERHNGILKQIAYKLARGTRRGADARTEICTVRHEH